MFCKDSLASRGPYRAIRQRGFPLARKRGGSCGGEEMTPRTSDVANVILIGAALIAAFLMDAAIPPRSYFSSAPFAIPILIAAVRLRPRGIGVTTVLAAMVAIVAAHFDRAPPIPATFSLLSLLVIGTLAMLLSQQSRIAAQQARDAEGARQQVSRILSSITDAFCALDRDWRFIYLNAAAERIFQVIFQGVPRELIGRNLWEEFPRAWDSEFGRELRRAMTEQTPFAYEAFYRPAATWLEIHAYPTPDGLSLYFRDITARKGAEEERERLLTEVQVARARLQTILESAANAIVYFDALNGQVVANPATGRVFGRPITPETGFADYTAQILHPDGSAVAPEQLPSHRALQGQTVPQQEMLIAQPNGHRVPVLESAAPVRGSGGRVIGAVAVFQDISALKELERLREEWTSVIAHDLRQPITIITGYADMLAKKLQEPENLEERKAAEHILASVRSLNKMVRDLLDVSRIEARRIVLNCRPTDLPSLIRAAVERMAAMTRGHAVVIQIRGAIPPAEVDPDRIEQVLGNLLSNAAKYSYPDSEIQLVVESRDGNAELAVSNRGPGISPDELPKLFTRFYRTREARAGPVVGLGLGLYISKGLVEAHGGKIWARSTPGETTTFYVTLPLRPGSARREP